MRDKNCTNDGLNLEQIDCELADAIEELGLKEYVLDAGAEADRPIATDEVLAHVDFGRYRADSNEEDSMRFEIRYTVGTNWTVIRDVPGLHQIGLGQFPTAYGAVGVVRRHHPQIDRPVGSSPTYPRWAIEDVSPVLAKEFAERDLMRYVLDVDFESEEVLLGPNTRRFKIRLAEDGGKWDGWISDRDSTEIFASDADPIEVAANLEECLNQGDTR